MCPIDKRWFRGKRLYHMECGCYWKVFMAWQRKKICYKSSGYIVCREMDWWEYKAPESASWG